VLASECKELQHVLLLFECSQLQQDAIYEADPSTEGATFCPIITGSDKTTVSVGTGHTEYHPLYVSNGLIHNNVRRAHRNGMSLLAFMCIPKSE
jgi:hypothetical protein